jgi:hypothetical protein
VGVMVEWIKEKITALASDEIQTLRENAGKVGRQDIVDQCNEVLASRKPVRTKRRRQPSTKIEPASMSRSFILCAQMSWALFATQMERFGPERGWWPRSMQKTL